MITFIFTSFNFFQLLSVQLEPHADDHGDGQEAEQDHRQHQPGVPGDDNDNDDGLGSKKIELLTLLCKYGNGKLLTPDHLQVSNLIREYMERVGDRGVGPD